MANLISSLLNLPNTDSWQVLDSSVENSLYLIHYTPDAPMSLFGHLSGLVLDLEAEVVVAKDYGYMPITTPAGKRGILEVDKTDNKIHLVSTSNPDKEYTLNPEETTLMPGFDGVLVRVFLHNGVVYYSTQRRLHMDEIRVSPEGPTYQEIYYSLGGPSGESLFDTSKKYSPYVHTFLMAAPSLQVASKNPIGAGYLLYLGTQEMWEGASPYPPEEIEQEPKIIPVETKFIPNPSLPRLYSPPAYSISRASKFLQRGYTKDKDRSWEDPRLLPGEFVVAYAPEKNQAYRIESPAYRWRNNMLDGEVEDLYEQYFILSNGKFMRLDLPPEREVYLRRFPILTPHSIEELRASLPILEWKQESSSEREEEILSGQEAQLYNIFLGFLYSVPIPDQEYVLDFYDRYWEDLTRVRDWLIRIYRDNTYRLNSIPREAKRLIGSAIGFAQEEIKKGNISRNVSEIVESNIEQLVNAEEGRSLYRLVQHITS